MTGAQKESLRVMIVAGEPSGDAHAAALVRALRQRAPATDFEFFGSTGAAMREAGVETVVRADDLAIVGLLEIAKSLPKFWRAFHALRRAAKERKPHAAVLVDWPDFNLRLARALHRKGVRIIYYISPQLWAWRSHRVRSIRRDVDLLLAILPFEKEWYNVRGVNQVKFIGHPLAGEVKPKFERAEFCRRYNLDPLRPLIALLPGSRRKELERILPPMLDAALSIKRARPDAQFVVTVAPNRSRAEVERVAEAKLNGSPLSDSLLIIERETREALAAADAAAVASGTATLEAALVGVPLVVVYKESLLNWHVLGSMITTEHFGLINLVAGERLAAELIQNDLSGERLAEELIALLDQERNRTFRERLREATSRLGEGGASLRAADAVLNSLRKWKAEGG